MAQSLNELLASKKKTSKALAISVGMSKPAIDFYRRGAREEISKALASAIAKALHTKLGKVQSAFRESRRRYLLRQQAGIDGRFCRSRDKFPT